MVDEKPYTKIFWTFGRRCGKSQLQYEYIKAMLEAGYKFDLVEVNGGRVIYLVSPRKMQGGK